MICLLQSVGQAGCKQTVKNLMWRLIWVRTVCLCPIKRTLDLNGLITYFSCKKNNLSDELCLLAFVRKLFTDCPDHLFRNSVCEELNLSRLVTIFFLFSQLLVFLVSLYFTQYRPRSDCSLMSSLIWVHIVRFHQKNLVCFNICSRCKKQMTFFRKKNIGRIRIKHSKMKLQNFAQISMTTFIVFKFW